MKNRKRPFVLLFLSVFFFGLSLYSIIYFPPSYTIALHFVTIPLFPLVVLSVWFFLLCFITLLTRSRLHGLLLSTSALTYLLLRFFGLTSIFFLIILLSIMGAIELFFFKRK